MHPSPSKVKTPLTWLIFLFFCIITIISITASATDSGIVSSRRSTHDSNGYHIHADTHSEPSEVYPHPAPLIHQSYNSELLTQDDAIQIAQFTGLSPMGNRIVKILQVPIDSATIPIGFRGIIDTSGLYSFLYFFSQSTPSLSASSKRVYTIESMVFRQVDFRTGTPSVSQRVPIQKLSVEIRWSNPIVSRTRILSDQLLRQSSLDHNSNTISNIPISFGDQTQRNFVMKPITDFLFILPDFTLPIDPAANLNPATTINLDNTCFISFVGVVIPTSQDLTTYRRAVQQGSMPASENPFYNAQLRITNVENSVNTVTTILIRSARWIALPLSTANTEPAYARLSLNTTTPILTGSYSVVRNQFDVVKQVSEIIEKLPDQQLLPKWPVFQSQLQTFYYTLYSYTQFPATTALLSTTSDVPPTFIPSFYAPRQLLPLSSNNPNSGSSSSTSNLVSNAAINTFNRLNNQFTSSTTLIAVALPSNTPIAETTDGTNAYNKALATQLSARSNTVAFPIQLRLVPFTMASTQFTVPQFTIGLWPKIGREFEWVDIQIQIQLVRLSTPLTGSDSNPSTTDGLLNMTDVSRNMGAMGLKDFSNLSTDDLNFYPINSDTGDGNSKLNSDNSRTTDDDDLDFPLDHRSSPITNIAHHLNPQRHRQHHHHHHQQQQQQQQQHKMATLQSSLDPNLIDPTISTPIISPELSPTLITSDLSQSKVSQLLQRVINPTTFDPNLPTMRYAMASLRKSDNDLPSQPPTTPPGPTRPSTTANSPNDDLNNTSGTEGNGGSAGNSNALFMTLQSTTATTTTGTNARANWENPQTDELYHFDYNLYALRANATSHNNNVEYAIVLFYQFIGKPVIPLVTTPTRPGVTNPTLMVSDWVPFITKLPTMNETIPSTFFPFEPILPNLNSVAFSSTSPGGGGTSIPGDTSIIPLIPNETTRGSNPTRTTLQPIRVNERVDLTTTEAVVGNPVSGTAPVRDPSTAGTITTNSTTTPTIPTNPGNTSGSGSRPITGTPTTGTTPVDTGSGSISNNPIPTTGNINTNIPSILSNFRATYPVSPLYSTIGYNITWFLIKYNPSSPYLFRQDVIPAHLRQEFLGTSLFAENIKNPSRDEFSNSLYVIEAIPSIAVRFIAEVLDLKINIHINDVYQGTWNMKPIVGEEAQVRFPSGVYNDIDGDGIRDSPALHNTDPQAYIRPFSGERWMSPVVQVHPNDLLAFSFTYQLRPYAKYIPEWADPRDAAYQTQVATTTLFHFAGAKSYVHALLPIESSSPDPAQLISSPAFKYSVKLRTTIPTTKAALSFTTGRISAQDGGLLGLPPIDPGVCFSTSQQLPLRGRFNVFMRLEFMPVSVVPLSPTAATRDSEGTLQSGFSATLPAGLRGNANTADANTSTTTMTAIINYVLSTLPPLLEDWFYFDGLIESTSSLLTADDYHATFTAALDVIAPFPDTDPGLRLRAIPSEELLLYAFTIWPQHNENDVSTSSSLIYSPDTFTSTGRAMGFGQCFPLHSVCF